jgi:hypothetical protein
MEPKYIELIEVESKRWWAGVRELGLLGRHWSKHMNFQLESRNKLKRSML